MDKVTNTQKFFILLGFFILGGVIGFFWNDILKLWSPDSTNGQTEVLDANGKPTGRFVNGSNGSARQRSCCSIGGGGFIGGCKYPIKPSDNIPPCTAI